MEFGTAEGIGLVVNFVTTAQSTAVNRADMPHAYGSDAYHSMTDEGLIGEEEIHDEER